MSQETANLPLTVAAEIIPAGDLSDCHKITDPNNRLVTEFIGPIAAKMERLNNGELRILIKNGKIGFYLEPAK